MVINFINLGVGDVGSVHAEQCKRNRRNEARYCGTGRTVITKNNQIANSRRLMENVISDFLLD